MPVYSRVFTIPAASEETYELEIEGDVITRVRIRFPPGPQGLFKIAILYGIKHVFPHEEDSYFWGDSEIIEWNEYWPLPESPCVLRIQAVNEDDTYEHSFGLVIVTQRDRDTLAGQIGSAIVRAVKSLLSVI